MKTERPIGDDEEAYWTDVAVYKPREGRPNGVVVARRGKQPKKRSRVEVYEGLALHVVARCGFVGGLCRLRGLC